MLTWVSGFLYLSPVVPRKIVFQFPHLKKIFRLLVRDDLTEVISSIRGLKSMGLVFDVVLSLSITGAAADNLS